MLRHHFFALAFLLGFSTQAHAITFAFATETTTDRTARVDIQYELTEPGPFSIDAELYPLGGPAYITASPRLVRFDLAYSFRSITADLTVTQDTFTSLFNGSESTPDDLAFHSEEYLSHVVGDAGLFGRPIGGSSDQWLFEFGRDFAPEPLPQITGRFIAVVSEPPMPAGVLLTLAAIGWRFRRIARRSAFKCANH